MDLLCGWKTFIEVTEQARDDGLHARWVQLRVWLQCVQSILSERLDDVPNVDQGYWNKQERNNQDLPEISIKNFLNGWQLDIKTQLQPIYLQQIHFYSGISFIFSFLNLYAVHVLIRCNKLNQNCSFFALLYEVFLCFKKVCDESCLRDSNLYKLLVLVCIVN